MLQSYVESLSDEASIAAGIDEVRRAVMSAMETGQHSRARTLIREFADVNLESARTLRADVVKSYGVNI